MLLRKEKMPQTNNLIPWKKQRLTDKQNGRFHLPRIYTRSVDQSILRRDGHARKNTQLECENAPIKFLKKNLDMRRVKLSMNPLRSLEKNIRNELVSSNGCHDSAPVLGNGIKLTQASRNEQIAERGEVVSPRDSLKQKHSNLSQVEIRLGREKINLMIKVQFCSKISMDTERQHNFSPMYYLQAVSGLTCGRSVNLSLERLTDSQLVLKMNEKMLKKSITLAFYQVAVPETVNSRKKISYMVIPLPLSKIKQSHEVMMTTVVKMWDTSHQEFQTPKLFIIIEKT